MPVLAGLVELERDLGHVAADVDLPQEEHLVQGMIIYMTLKHLADRWERSLKMLIKITIFDLLQY